MKKALKQQHTPRMQWQAGAYERIAEFRFLLPYQFLLLCRLTDITPLQAIRDFTDALDGGTSSRPVSDEAKEHAINYFISRGYGQQHYTPEELRLLFKEMQAVKLLFPNDADPDMEQLYADWRDAHHNWWFNTWFNKSRRT